MTKGKLKLVHSVEHPDANGERIEIGEIAPHWTKPLEGDCSQFAVDVEHTGMTLTIYIANPTDAHIRGVNHGRSQFGIYPWADTGFFFLYEIEGLARWESAAYCTVATDRPHSKGQLNSGRLLTIILANPKTGIITALRRVTLSPSFGAKLDEYLEAGDRVPTGKFDEVQHMREFRRALETHRTWNEMAKHAAVVEQAGIDI
jgi:hypothetical protein